MIIAQIIKTRIPGKKWLKQGELVTTPCGQIFLNSLCCSLISLAESEVFFWRAAIVAASSFSIVPSFLFPLFPDILPEAFTHSLKKKAVTEKYSFQMTEILTVKEEQLDAI